MKRLIIIVIFCAVGAVQAESLTIAYDTGIPPYSYSNEQGEAAGAVVDIWRAWADVSGHDIAFVSCGVDACLKLLKEKKVDAIAALRGELEDSSLIVGRTISRTVTAVFVRRDIEVSTLLELDQAITLVNEPRLLRQLNNKLPDLPLNLLDNSAELQGLINSRQLEVFVAERADPISEHLENPAPEGYRHFFHLTTSDLRPVLRKDSLSLFRSMMKGSETIGMDVLLDIADKYHLGIQKKTSNTALFVFLLIVVALLVLLAVYLVRSLNKHKERVDGDTKDWGAIIRKGESQKIEFKSSFHWDYRKQETNKSLENIILKTISAFLNSEGGILFIGVDDDGSVLGLENDYSTFSKKNSDGLSLALTNLLNQKLGKNIHSFIKIDIVGVNNSEICIVNVSACDKPVFLKEGASEAFYIRASASSQPLSMSEAFEYIKGRWASK
ncbi:Predicted transcriptional regulator containing an HTH domain and an uncharacterized domain shared with the mammalian protein Schlafen [Alteromonadaceae bacterium Bs31]|nr:Predicted transcriptional regulator containing an HTH domain and an uncharacterized domain shared with the mammalian protein Schlafen [Alteromonadaceae bacterium Bs31]